jgi:TolB protein
MNDEPLHIFISYSRSDEVFARRLATDLISKGADVWLDVIRIVGGQDWGEAIQAGLDSANTMVLIISPKSMESKNVGDEWKYYLDNGKRIVPVLLEPATVSFQLRRLQYADFYNAAYEDALTKLWNYLQGKAGSLTPGNPDAVQDTFVGARTPPGLPRPLVIFIAALVLVGVVGGGLLLNNRTGTATPTITATQIGSNETTTPDALVIPTKTHAPTNVPTETPTKTSTFTATATNTAEPPTAAPTNTSEPTSTPPNLNLGGGTGKIAFVRNGDIWICDVDGKNAEVLYTSTNEEAVPAWSPDGTQIAFRSKVSGNSEVFVVNAEGTNLRPITRDNAPDTNPTWSGDGKKIAYRSSRGNAEIWSADSTDGGNRVNLSNSSAEDLTPKWSRDGRFIVFSSNRGGNYEIWIMNADGSNARQVTSNNGNNFTPAISPDGSKVVYSSDFGPELGFGIFIINADGSNQLRLLGDGKFNESPDFSPDGKYIAFSSASSSAGARSIYIMNTDGLDLKKITDGDQPSWQPAPSN